MVRLVVMDADRCVGCQMCMFACNRRFGEGGLEKAALKVKSTGGFERGFVVVACRACPDPPCLKVCPVGALDYRKSGGVLLNANKCIGCGRCVDACPVQAVFWDKNANKPDICVHCGYCVGYCPYNVLAMKEVESFEVAD